MAIIRPASPEELDRASDSMKDRFTGGNTLCNHIRETYFLAGRIEDTGLRHMIQRECLEMLVYAKRMDDKLMEYHNRKQYNL